MFCLWLKKPVQARRVCYGHPFQPARVYPKKNLQWQGLRNHGAMNAMVTKIAHHVCPKGAAHRGLFPQMCPFFPFR